MATVEEGRVPSSTSHVSLSSIPSLAQSIPINSEKLRKILRELETAAEKEMEAFDKALAKVEKKKTVVMVKQIQAISSLVGIEQEELESMLTSLSVPTPSESVRLFFSSLHEYRQCLLDGSESPSHFPKGTVDDATLFMRLISEEVLSFGWALVQALRMRHTVKEALFKAHRLRFDALSSVVEARLAEKVDEVVARRHIHPLDLLTHETEKEQDQTDAVSVDRYSEGKDSVESGTSFASLGSFVSVSSQGSSQSLRSKKTRERKRKAALEEITQLSSSPQIFLDRFLKSWREKEMVKSRAKELEKERKRLREKLDSMRKSLDDLRESQERGYVEFSSSPFSFDVEEKREGSQDVDENHRDTPSSLFSFCASEVEGEGPVLFSKREDTRTKEGETADVGQQRQAHHRKDLETDRKSSEVESDSSTAVKEDYGSLIGVLVNRLSLEEKTLIAAKREQDAVVNRLQRMSDGIRRLSQTAQAAMASRIPRDQSRNAVSWEGSVGALSSLETVTADNTAAAVGQVAKGVSFAKENIEKRDDEREDSITSSISCYDAQSWSSMVTPDAAFGLPHNPSPELQELGDCLEKLLDRLGGTVPRPPSLLRSDIADEPFQNNLSSVRESSLPFSVSESSDKKGSAEKNIHKVDAKPGSSGKDVQKKSSRKKRAPGTKDEPVSVSRSRAGKGQASSTSTNDEKDEERFAAKTSESTSQDAQLWQRRSGSRVLPPQSLPSLRRTKNSRGDGTGLWEPAHFPNADAMKGGVKLSFPAREDDSTSWRDRQQSAGLPVESTEKKVPGVSPVSADSTESDGSEDEVLDTEALRKQLKQQYL